MHAILIIFFLFFQKSYASNSIEDYQSIFIPVSNSQGEMKIAIRSYFSNNQQYYLLVNPITLVTETGKAINFTHRKPLQNNTSNYFTSREIEDIPYLKALRKYSSSPYLIQNYGLTHSDNVKGIFLSIDLCPSVRPFDISFFKKLLEISSKEGNSFPVSLAISGLWILHHQKEFNWLINHKNQLDIIWVNHSFSHPYYKSKPLNENFLLSPKVDMKNEVLMTEKILLQNNQIPSVFFRFPGLVSNELTVKEINKLCLLPIGSDAWLAKGEKPKPGSIVLIHGNGNEPKGINMASKLIENNIKWLPLYKALSL
ncbi:hypothetical protein RL73_01725 [Liberibacter crescens]|nr:hypothetical protein RL73_01725 [Liberibacter crescens]